MERKLIVTSSPHIRAKTSTQSVMRDVLIALCPALIAGCYYFGWRAFLLCAVCVISSVLFEFLYRKLMHLPQTIGDLSAAVTGLLLALNLPVSFPPWMALIGSFVAIIVVKQLFGGLGKNFANPAIVGRIVLMLSFATQMSSNVLPAAADALSGATPLVATNAGGALPSYMDLFLGRIGGSIGETCKLALLLGAAYLIIRRVITPTAPLAFIGTVFVFSAVFGLDPVYQILSGGLILCAFFMATDYVTTPTTESGKLIFGIGCGLVTIVLRRFSAYPEGASFALLLMNILTPHIDQLCRKKAFGGDSK